MYSQLKKFDRVDVVIISALRSISAGTIDGVIVKGKSPLAHRFSHGASSPIKTSGLSSVQMLLSGDVMGLRYSLRCVWCASGVCWGPPHACMWGVCFCVEISSECALVRLTPLYANALSVVDA